MMQRFREKLRSVCERAPWTAPSLVDSEVLVGLMLFVLIVAIIVFGPSQSYRFYYGPQF
ncbi:MAG: hypothetical protein JO024_01240 [Candidatus Eremiobacteraeota bacterium]|nr:hypothetical protein [Candidatus Eremiobacteraeota bacterium]